MNMELLIAFMIYAFVSAGTPGPNNVMLLASGVHFGVRKTVPHIMGVAFGFGFMVFLAGMGLLSILSDLPLVYEILHVVSIVYLLYLAWKIATAEPLHNGKATQKKPMTFLQAAAFQWVNPKAIMMAIVAITTYVPEQKIGEALFLAVGAVSVGYSVASLFCATTWAAFGSGFQRFLKNPLHYKIFNITMAVLLILSLYPLLIEILT